MASNTKLTSEQKVELKEFKFNFSHDNINVVNLDNKTTIVYQEKGNTVEFSLSVMSDDEIKFRRKVGEYFAMLRFFNGETVKMDKFDFMVMTENVWGAYLLADQ